VLSERFTVGYKTALV